MGESRKELKQGVAPIRGKVTTYQGQIVRFKLNTMLQNNQRQFQSELNEEEERCKDPKFDIEESKTFF